jgi:hypothetical protein
MSQINVAAARTIRQRVSPAEQVQTALNTRILIEQAKCVIAERHHVNLDQAFNLLRSTARTDNRRLPTSPLNGSWLVVVSFGPEVAKISSRLVAAQTRYSARGCTLRAGGQATGNLGWLWSDSDSRLPRFNEAAVRPRE